MTRNHCMKQEVLLSEKHQKRFLHGLASFRRTHVHTSGPHACTSTVPLHLPGSKGLVQLHRVTMDSSTQSR